MKNFILNGTKLVIIALLLCVWLNGLYLDGLMDDGQLAVVVLSTLALGAFLFWCAFL